MIICPDCSADFGSRGERYRHRRQIHGFVTCTCSRIFLKQEYMQMHLEMIRQHTLGKGSFQCVDCRQRFRKRKHLTDHMVKKGHDCLDSISIGLSKLHVSASDLNNYELYRLRSSEVNKFIADYVQADTEFLSCCGDKINSLVLHLHNLPGKLQPRRIIKSGSLGKGTAVKDKSDIDLVMMLNNYREVGQLMKEMPNLLHDLKRHLLQFSQAEYQRSTPYSAQVDISCRAGHTHSADILPAVDLLGLEHTPREIYLKMKCATEENIHEYSVSLVPLQLDIMKRLPTKVKSLIQLLKYWKNKKLKERNETEMPSFASKRIGRSNWPSSYALELVVIGAWNDAGNPENFDMTKALHAVLKSLVNHNSFRIIFKDQMVYDMDMLRISKTPYIMDPANPFNDMYHGLVGGEAFDWEQVVPEAERWLGRDLFCGVITSGEW